MRGVARRLSQSDQAAATNRLSRACAFLHNEFEPDFYWWELVVLLERIFLSGMLLLIPHERQMLRLVFALLLSLQLLSCSCWQCRSTVPFISMLQSRRMLA